MILRIQFRAVNIIYLIVIFSSLLILLVTPHCDCIYHPRPPSRADSGLTSTFHYPPGTNSRCNTGEIQWEKDMRCYKRSQRGPCGNNMLIVPSLEDKNIGRCICGNNKSKSRKRFLIYHVRFNQCYELYTPGPCSSAKWLVVKNGKPACESNPCLYFTYHVEYAVREFVSFKGECEELHEPSTECPPGQVISFSNEKGKKFNIVCTFPKKWGAKSLSLVPPDEVCPADQAVDINGFCRQLVELDFDVN